MFRGCDKGLQVEVASFFGVTNQTDWEPFLSMADHGLRADLKVLYVSSGFNPDLQMGLAHIQECCLQYTWAEEFSLSCQCCWFML